MKVKYVALFVYLYLFWFDSFFFLLSMSFLLFFLLLLQALYTNTHIFLIHLYFDLLTIFIFCSFLLIFCRVHFAVHQRDLWFSYPFCSLPAFYLFMSISPCAFMSAILVLFPLWFHFCSFFYFALSFFFIVSPMYFDRWEQRLHFLCALNPIHIFPLKLDVCACVFMMCTFHLYVYLECVPFEIWFQVSYWWTWWTWLSGLHTM